ncbi:Snx3p KNAG_0E00280 [Huiozyma naganishii CBS 8797]|uniref:Sorting nexin-3 n=1 Tax=Huiozyma naganishii (strain ATCC MYA-139 / BCRC 22969 / CBS 8797 / KCTC 17520 / NBRC 10181 / NCYC 3082 / Yp74L-3) TaxID=1071383 RepID=J7S7F0_HUIN7|nr:hypothetical protein KNAG_0E00280 [Kazachstania naganishii CBS 8797]CCK70296.1 hypothetical protein KNAG_0E00280 [Kazachstania naganishii CBS 8797]
MRPFQSFSTTEHSTFSSPSPTGPDTPAQYGEPESLMEVEVGAPQTHKIGGETFTDYEVTARTNLPGYARGTTVVRRRYSDFEHLRQCLKNEMVVTNRTRVKIPHLPGKIFLSNRFDERVIEERQRGLDKWLKSVAGHPLLQVGSAVLVRFLQSRVFSG